jgi:hypothetical protein
MKKDNNDIWNNNLCRITSKKIFTTIRKGVVDNIPKKDIIFTLNEYKNKIFGSTKGVSGFGLGAKEFL